MFGGSNDQSGTVGFLVGLIVLVFVGIFFSMAVDKRFKFSSGRLSLEEVITEEKHQLDTVKRHLDAAQKDWKEKFHPLKGQPERLVEAKAEAGSSGIRLSELREERAALESALKSELASFTEYRDRFRKQVRQAGAGEKLEELRTSDGKVYQGVTIRRVTPAGMVIAHTLGISRLRPEELDASWQQRFQWDADELAAVLKDEQAVAAKHQASLERATEPKRPAKPDPGISPEKRAKQEGDRKLASLRRDVSETKRRLDRSEMEIARVRSDAQMNRGRSVPGSLETWDERLSRMESASAAFRAQYMAARGRLATVAPGDALLRDAAE